MVTVEPMRHAAAVGIVGLQDARRAAWSVVLRRTKVNLCVQIAWHFAVAASLIDLLRCNSTARPSDDDVEGECVHRLAGRAVTVHRSILMSGNSSFTVVVGILRRPRIQTTRAAMPAPVMVAPGVYRLLGAGGDVGPANDGRTANAAFVVGPRGVVVFDTGICTGKERNHRRRREHLEAADSPRGPHAPQSRGDLRRSRIPGARIPVLRIAALPN